MRTLINEVYGVWRFERPARFVGKARSTPGHLIHFVASGGYELTTDNRTTTVEAGDLIYYYESEVVLWRGGDTSVVFYSVGLDAPSLPPPRLGRRHVPGRIDLHETFVNALELQNGPATIHAQLRLSGLVSRIVAEFHDSSDPIPEPDQPLWWQVEYGVRRRRAFRATLPQLCEIAGYSRATVIRACRESTGKSPMVRLRELRIEEAKGLLLYSMSSVTHVAFQLGYRRIHEFSREFSQAVGMPPTAYREKALSEASSAND